MNTENAMAAENAKGADFGLAPRASPPARGLQTLPTPGPPSNARATRPTEYMRIGCVCFCPESVCAGTREPGGFSRKQCKNQNRLQGLSRIKHNFRQRQVRKPPAPPS